MLIEPYEVRPFAFGELAGISEEQIEVHLGLYEGYVKNVNELNEQLVVLANDGEGGTPIWAELKRHLGFEYNGMRLHEYYFENLVAGGGELDARSRLGRAIEAAFNGIGAWREEFSSVGGMRGVGWAVLYQDPANGRLTNHWISLHEEGTLAGFRPILVMDVWEHAFMVDYKPSEKQHYIEAFLSNVDWAACERRLVGANRAVHRAA